MLEEDEDEVAVVEVGERVEEGEEEDVAVPEEVLQHRTDILIWFLIG